MDRFLFSCEESFGGRCRSELLSPAAETSTKNYLDSVKKFQGHTGNLKEFAERRRKKQADSDLEDRLICLKQHLPALEVLGKTIKENKKLLEDYSNIKCQFQGLNVIISQYKSLLEVKDKEIIDWKRKCKEQEELNSTLRKESKASQRLAKKYLRAFIVVAEMLQKRGMLPKVYERHLGNWRMEQQEDRTRDKGIRRLSNVHEQCRTVNLNIQDVSSPCATGSVCSINTGFESSVNLSDNDHCVAPQITLSPKKDILLRYRKKLKKSGKDNPQPAKTHGNNVIVETSVDSDSSCESIRNNFSINNSKKPVTKKIKRQIETGKVMNEESLALTKQVTENAGKVELDKLAPYQEPSMPVIDNEPFSDEINITNMNFSIRNNLNVTDRSIHENPDFGCFHSEETGFRNELNDVSDIQFNKSPTLSQNQMESTAVNLVFGYSDTENVSVNLDNQEENSLAYNSKDKEISRILNEMCVLQKVLSPIPSEPGTI